MNLVTDWTWVELILLILTAGLIVFWDLRFQPVQRRLLRLSCSFMAIGALIFLYLEPTLQVEAPERTGAIFTQPVTAFQKDSILQNSHLIEVSSIGGPEGLHHTINEIQIHGDGLNPWQLERIEGYKTDWQQPDLKEGIVGIQVPKILEGVPFQITGDITIREALMLSLIDPNGISSDQKMTPENTGFQFVSEVRTAGLFLYELLGVRGGDTIFSESLPVEVLPSRRANVLLLGSFPSFEWNYLKNHLGDLGLGVASKFQLSKDVAHTEFLNMPTLNLSVINRELLQSFKLMVMDGDAFEQLTNRQKREIFQTVELAEIGLFLMIDDLSELEPLATLNVVNGSGEVVVSTAEKQISLLKMPFSIRDRNWNQLSFQGQEIGGYTSRGIGKIGFSMIANSHILELQGVPEVYGHFWDQLLSPIIGFDISADQFYLRAFNFLDQQMDISFSYFGHPNVTIDGQLVPPINSPIRPDLWTVSYWPRKQGWHTIEVDGEGQSYFFVHAAKDWEVLQRFEKQTYNRLYFATNEVMDRESRQIEKPISRWIPFVVFLIAVGGLWLERKLS